MVFYYSGLFDASENDYIFDDYIGVLVYTLIGCFYHAENKLAKIYINYQHACSLVPACTAALQLATHAACMARLLRALERECARVRRHRLATASSRCLTCTSLIPDLVPLSDLVPLPGAGRRSPTPAAAAAAAAAAAQPQP